MVKINLTCSKSEINPHQHTTSLLVFHFFFNPNINVNINVSNVSLTKLNKNRFTTTICHLGPGAGFLNIKHKQRITINIYFQLTKDN